jgi:hypothetical protein
MSLLPTSTYAGPSQAEALWATAGSVGPGGGVTQLFAGNGIILDPSTGEGDVTISVVGGGGGGGVTSVVAGPGIGVSSPAGDVTVSNTGVTSMVAGGGITLSAATGTVTVTATGSPSNAYIVVNAPPFLQAGGGTVGIPANLCYITNMNTIGAFVKEFQCFIWNNNWSPNDTFLVTNTSSLNNSTVTDGGFVMGITASYAPAGGGGTLQGIRVNITCNVQPNAGTASATLLRIPAFAGPPWPSA